MEDVLQYYLRKGPRAVNFLMSESFFALFS